MAASGGPLLRRLLALALLAAVAAPSRSLAESPGRHIVATIPGELVIGTLIPVHERPEAKQAQTRTCGPPREQYGIQRVEAALRTIDLINRDPKILPNVSLGIEIRDTCWHSPIALEQSIEFIRNSMAMAATSADELHFGQLPALASADPNLVATCSSLVQKSNKKLKNIAGVVGPASSQDTVQVQNLLQMFNMPQVGYSATSSELSEKNYFKYFLRVVPSDELQAQVMIDLMLAHNWTYVTVVYTEGSYGTNLMKAFRERAQLNEICTATLESVPPNAEEAKFDELIGALQKHRSAYVVVCMCEGRTVSRLFAALKRHNLRQDFLVVGSDGWADRFDVVEDKESFAVGGISIRIHSAYVSDFDHYYFQLDPANNSRDPWFREFWEYRFQCQLAPLSNQAKASPPKTQSYPRNCTGNESLRPNYKQDTKMAFVQKAILTMAMGLDKLQRATCGEPKLGVCPEMLPLNGSQLIQHLMNVSFNYLGERVSFDEKGDPPGTYEILNFQSLAPGNGAEEEELKHWDNLNRTSSVAPDDPMYDSYKTLNAPRDPEAIGRPKPTPPAGYWSRDRRLRYQYAHVGSWDSANGLSLFGRFQWPRRNASELKTSEIDWRPVPRSVCSEQCLKGHAKQKIQTDSIKCCWICVACKPNEFLLDPYHCQACERGWWPTPDHTGCYRLPIRHMNWRQMEVMSAIHVGVFGLFLTAGTLYVLLLHNETPVVKSSSRELSYMILFAMLLCHATTFFLVARPTVFTCSMTRVLPGAGYAMMYGALVTKTNRIARILAGSKKRIMTRRPMFMSAASQLAIAWLIILLEGLIIVGSLLYEPPDVAFEYPDEQRRVNMVCNTSTQGTLAPLVFDFFLILMCTWYAFKTRNVPQNFNEAKFIGFTMYTTLVIWVAFVVIYLGSAHKIITLCLCNSFSALFALFLLFFPRLYVILFRPEKNNRSYFTTAKNLRCHIGHTAGSSGAAAAAEAAAELRQPYSRRPQQQQDCNSLDWDQLAEPVSLARPSLRQRAASPSPPPLATSVALARTSSVLGREPEPDNSAHPDQSCAGALARLRAWFLQGHRRRQSKRALSIQRRIRAIRRAENLDRQLHIRQSQVQRHVQCFEAAAEPGARGQRRLVSAATGSARLDPRDAQDMFELLRLLIGPRNMYLLLERLAQLAKGGGGGPSPGARLEALELLARLVSDALDGLLEPVHVQPGSLCKSGLAERDGAPDRCVMEEECDEEEEEEEEDPIKRALECIMGLRQRRRRTEQLPRPALCSVSSHRDDNNNGNHYNVPEPTFISGHRRRHHHCHRAGRQASQTSLLDGHVGAGRGPILRSSSEASTCVLARADGNSSQQQDPGGARQSIGPSPRADNWARKGQGQSEQEEPSGTANECNIMSSLDVIKTTNCHREPHDLAKQEEKLRQLTVSGAARVASSTPPSMSQPVNVFTSLPVSLGKKQHQRAKFIDSLGELVSRPVDEAPLTGEADAGARQNQSRHLAFAGPQPERSISLNNTANVNECPPIWTSPVTKSKQTTSIVGSATTVNNSSEDSRV